MAQAEDGRSEVELASAQVRRMLGRISLVEPHVVLATLEALVEAAQRCHHREVDFFKAAFAEVRKHDGAEGFNHLVLQLFGSPEDKRVATALTNWHKMRRAEGAGGKPAAKPRMAAPASPPAEPPYPPPQSPPYYPYAYSQPSPPSSTSEVPPTAQDVVEGQEVQRGVVRVGRLGAAAMGVVRWATEWPIVVPLRTSGPPRGTEDYMWHIAVT